MASKTPPSDLAAWIAGRRWFAGKARGLSRVEVVDRVPLAHGVLCLLRVTLDDGAADVYAAPLAATDPPRDALEDPVYARALLDLVARGGRADGEHGAIVGHATVAFPRSLPAVLAVRPLGGEQSNTSLRFGDAVVLKHFRRLVPGENPEIEITRFLTELTPFRGTPRLAGWLEYVDADGGAWALGVAQELVAGRDGWAWTLERLAAGDTPSPALHALGRRTAELHLALATGATPSFAPEPITPTDVAAWTEAVRSQIDAAGSAVRRSAQSAVAAVGESVSMRSVSAATISDALGSLVGVVKQRHHGDFHLGQTLRSDQGDWAIIDFEGEPLRPLAERRRKHAPVRDVAGMLRSLHYAVATARRGSEDEMRRAFLAGYRETARGAPFLPVSEAATARAIAAFELEKAAYEIVYEAGHRPEWIGIPLAGYARASATLAGPAAAGAA